MEDLKSAYDEIKKLLAKLDKNGFLDTYGPKDFFINKFEEANKSFVVRVNDKFYGHYKAIEIYYNVDGFNYLTDTIATDEYYARFFEMDGYAIMYLPSDAITEFEGKMLHNLGYKIKKYGNILIFKYTQGKGRTTPSMDEFMDIFNNLDYIYSLLKTEETDVINAFDQGHCVISVIEMEKLQYSVFYPERPEICRMPKRFKAVPEFAEEYKNYAYMEEAYLFTSYYPMVIKETNVRPLLITYLIPDKSISVRYIITARSTYKDVIFGIMDDIFTKTGMLPEKLFFDNRDLLQILRNTLDLMHIEHELIANTSLPFSKEMAKKKGYTPKPGSEDLLSDKVKRSEVETFLTYMVSSLKDIDMSMVPALSELEEQVDNEDEEEEGETPDFTDTDLVA